MARAFELWERGAEYDWWCRLWLARARVVKTNSVVFREELSTFVPRLTELHERGDIDATHWLQRVRGELGLHAESKTARAMQTQLARARHWGAIGQPNPSVPCSVC